MNQITNKKELLAALAEWVPSSIDSEGNPRIASLFTELESDRAFEISKDIVLNVRDELNSHSFIVDMSPQQFVKICGRNIDLNTELELLHFMWHSGIMWERTLTRLAALKELKNLKPPTIGDN